MASSININQNNNDVTLQDNNRSISITDNNAGTTINVTQPVTNVVTVATPGPQGPVGPIPTSGSFTGSFSGSFIGDLTGTASYATSASYALTASYVQNAISSSYALSSSNAISASFASTASYVQNAQSASYVLQAVSASFATSASYTQNATSASYAQTSSYVQNAQTTSYILQTVSASFSSTASYVNPLNQNVTITGSLTVSGSSTFTNIGPAIFSGSVNGNSGFSGSFSGSFQGNGSGLTNISASGIVGLNLSQIAAGSVSASISTGTGSFTVTSGSNTFMFVSSSGNVGFGTTTPRAKLDINGQTIIGNSNKTNGPWPLYISDSSNLAWKVADSAGNAKFEFYAGFSSINQMRLLNNVSLIGFGQNLVLGTEIVPTALSIVNSTGNVLINTTTDAGYKLDVNGTARIKGSGATSATTSLRVENTNTSASLVVLDNGNVGIATTNPSAKLNVGGSSGGSAGTFLVQSNTDSEWFSIGTVGAGIIQFNSQGGSTRAGGIDLGARFNIAPISDSLPTLAIRGFSGGVSDIFRVSSPSQTSGDLFIIKSTGNVGIKTTTPGYDLDVNGTTNIVGNLIVTGSTQMAALTASSALINGNLTVIGTASFTYTTASIVNIGAATITLNTDNPAVRFGGMNVVDSGSFGNSSTGSLLWDSQMNRWIYSNPSGSTYDGGLLISGPRNTSGLGNEQGTTLNALMKGQGGDHITSSGVFEVSGSVGIGTSSPTNTLDVTGSVRFRGSATIGGSIYPSVAWSNYLTIGNDGTDKIITGYLSSSTNGAVIGAHNSALNAWSNLNVVGSNIVFRRVGEVEAMRVNSSSNVLIGTPTDTGHRFVSIGAGASGSVNLDSTLYVSGSRVGIGISSPAGKLDLYDSTSTFLYVRSGAVGANWQTAGVQSSIGTYTNHPFVLKTNDIDRMRIVNNGNVLIGTTTDAGFKLDVNGTARVSGSASPALTVTQGASGDAIVIENGGYIQMASTRFRAFGTGFQFQDNAYNIKVALSMNSFSYFNSGANYSLGTTIDSGARFTVRGSGATSATTALRVENTNASASLVVLDNGAVGIGTSTPSSSILLDVSGSVRTMNIVPATDNLYSIGASNLRFSSAFIGFSVIGTIYTTDIRSSLSGGVKIWSNASNQWAQWFDSTGNLLLQDGGTFTDNNYRLQVYATGSTNSGSLFVGGTTRATGSIARTMLISSSLSASANNDVLVGLDINPSFNTGAFTGVSNIAIRSSGDIIPTTIQSQGLGNNSRLWNVYARIVNSSGLPLDIGSNSQNISIKVAPTNGLQMFGTTGNVVLQNGGTFTDNGYRLQLNSSATNSGSLYISGSSSQPLLVVTSSAATALFVSGSGNVGIGTNNPGMSLSVVGNAQFGFTSTSAGARLHTRGAGTTNTSTSFRAENASQQTALIITDDLSARFDGKVGIGSGNFPTASLDVAGTTRISGSFNTAISGSILTVQGSGSAQPIFTVQGSQGELFSITDSLSGSLFSVNDISGLPILEVFSDNTTLIGNYQDPMLITTAKVVQTNSGSFTMYSLPTASYDTAFFEYSVRSGSNARAGTIMAIQLGSSVNFTETTTTDFGSTSAVSFTVIVTGSNMALTGSSTSGAWTIKTIVRGL